MSKTTIAALVLLVAVVGVLHLGFYRRIGDSDVPIYRGYGTAVLHRQIPYRDFEMEYPPAALPVFVAPAVVSHFSEHVAYDRAFQALMVLCAAAAVIAIATIRPGLPPVLYAIAPLLLGSIVLQRFDLWPAALAVAALAFLHLRHERSAFVLLATAVAAKLWPAALLPLFFVAADRRKGAATVFALTLTMWFVPFLALAPGGLVHSIRGQIARPLQLESLGASALVVGGADVSRFVSHGSDNLRGQGVATATALLVAFEITTLVGIWVAFARSRRDLVRWSAAAVAALVTFSKVLSPQFLVWPLAFLPLVRTRRVLLSPLLAGALVLTQVEYPSRYVEYQHFDGGVAAVVLARNLILLTIVATLCWPHRRRSSASLDRGQFALPSALFAQAVRGRSRGIAGERFLRGVGLRFAAAAQPSPRST